MFSPSRRRLLAFVFMVPALGLTGCGRDRSSGQPETVSLVLGMDKYYEDPKYNQYTGPATGRDRVLARVNGEAIRREQLDERLVGIVDLRIAEGKPVDARSMDSVRANLLDTLISLTVERQEALRREIPVEPEDVDKVIARIQEEQQGAGNLAQVLRDGGISDEEFRRLCEQEVRVMKLREMILEEPVPEPTEEDLWAYYRENRDKWTRVRASSIFFSAPRSLPPVERLNRRQLAEKVRTMAVQGADFAALAKEYSEDEATRDAGGDMGWIPFLMVDEKVRSVIKELALGGVSDLVEIETPAGSEGFSIFKLTEFERLTPEDPKLHAILTIEWKKRKSQEHYREWLVEKRNESSIVILDTRIRDSLGV